MHPVLGTMMPEICEAPHLPISLFHPSFGSVFNEWDAFITFLHASSGGIERLCRHGAAQPNQAFQRDDNQCCQ